MRIEGEIIRGKQLGRTLGFPTANLSPTSHQPFEKKGVYAAWFYLDGQKLPCMLNIGRHPTLPEGEMSIEAHIFDFSGDLYGRHAAVETVAFLRGEVEFESIEQLKAQLERDKITSLNILTSGRID